MNETTPTKDARGGALATVGTIYRKEMREVLRDRRTLVFMIVFPLLLIPLLLSLVTELVSSAVEKAEAETVRYALYDGERLPGLAEALTQDPGFEAVEGVAREDIKAAIRDERLTMALTVREPFDAGAGPQTTVDLFYNGASKISKVERKTETVLKRQGERLRVARLEALGLDSPDKQSAVLEPVKLETHNTADMREVLGEQAGGMLPYMFIIFCYLGALYPAIDLAAGEKERGTLETLLLAPIPRVLLVLGKFLVVFTAGVVSALLSIAGLGLWLVYQGQEVGGALGEIIKSVTALDLTLIGLMLVPMAAMFSALLLSISIYAKSFKEAQSYSAPLNMLVIMPAVLAMLPGIELDWTWALVPITNISLAIKELIKGTMDYTMLVAILGSSVVIAAACLVFCTWWFNREDVLFRG
ncbi:MAG: ABC transporter permease [Myxococcales bacterium]|nr:ABC transporter permease [Myxococcales bacterium]